MSPHASPDATGPAILTGGREEWLIPVTEHIRETIALTGRASKPKPMAHAYLEDRDPSELAIIAVRAIRDAIREENLTVTRLALVIGATAEHERMVRHCAESGFGWAPWGAEVRIRVGLYLLNCVLMATGWFSVAHDPHSVAPETGVRRGPKVVLVTRENLAPWLGERLDRDIPEPTGYRPTIRELEPPFRTLRGLLAMRPVTLARTEVTEVFPGGDIETSRAEAGAAA